MEGMAMGHGAHGGLMVDGLDHSVLGHPTARPRDNVHRAVVSHRLNCKENCEYEGHHYRTNH